jgi:hypothetical protein
MAQSKRYAAMETTSVILVRAMCGLYTGSLFAVLQSTAQRNEFNALGNTRNLRSRIAEREIDHATV